MYGISVLCSSRVVSLRSIRYKSSSKKLLEFLAEMPKSNAARISETQRQRQNVYKKSEKYGPSTVYLQVLGSGARGAANTLYLFTDQKRYLFNCGESTQRLAHEHKVKLSKLEHIFITSKSWRNIGGLPGLSLTLQDVGVPSITLHGPDGLNELYNATKRFVVMKEMLVNTVKCNPLEDFEDNAMTVKYVLLGPNDDIILNPDQKGPSPKRQKLDSPSDQEFVEFIHDETDYYKKEPFRNMVKVDHKGSPSKVVNKDRHKAQAAKNSPDRSATTADSLKTKNEKVLEDLQKKSNCTVAFICTLKKRLGTLDLAKCVEKGVKPGPLLGQLKSGQDVVLPDGTMIMSKDVKTPDDPGPVFIVMEVPDISYLRVNEFSAHFADGNNPPENIPCLIVHYTPPQVFHHPDYRTFLSKFGPDTRHLLINTQNSCLGSEAVHRTQHKLHLLDSDIFPLLRDASLPAVWNSSPPPNNNSPTRRRIEELKNKIALAQFQNIINIEGSFRGDNHICKEEGDGTKLDVIAGRTLTVFNLRPKKQLDRSHEPKLHIQDYIQETMDIDGFVASMEQFQRQASNIRFKKGHVQKEYPKVIFLGTGSCIPSKTRNTSGIVLQVDENRSILLDCGEGTFGQLVRFFGPKKVNGFLRTLKAIYVSHLHADHHIGLIGVLQARREALEQAEQTVDPIYLLAPGQIFSWLSLYDQQFERIKTDFQLIPNQNLLEGQTTLEASSTEKEKDMSPAMLANIGVQDIQTCFVTHCPNAFGVAITLNDDKITYSGDTIPCESLVTLGKNSTLLIHEATMEDELVDEARIKMHSTTSQAIEIGQQMNAKYTLLTHFSQRYARLPRLNPHILNDNKSVGITFDNMQITMNDIELLPQMYAPLQLMFAEHCVEMEMKAQNRARTRAKQSSPSPNRDEKKGKAVSPKQRNAYPGCRPVAMPIMSNAKYRESNASRLRKEMKGMPVSGVVKNRSLTSSPDRRGTTSRSGSLQSEVMGSSPDTEGSEGYIMVNIDLNTPRSNSSSSNVSYLSRSSKGSSIGAHVVNNFAILSIWRSLKPKKIQENCLFSRSKTFHSIEDLEEHIKDKQQTPLGAIPQNTTIGYGKPLVTPLHMKLNLRREWERNTVVNKPVCNTSRLSPPKSPTKSLKVDFKYPRPASKIPEPPAVRSRLPTKQTASAHDIRGARQSSTGETGAAKKTADKPQRHSSSPKTFSHKSPTNIRSRNLKPSVTDVKESAAKSPPPSPKLMRGQVKSAPPSSRDLVKSAPPCSRDQVKSTPGIRNFPEKPRPREAPAPLFSPGRPISIHCAKTFKPQLEDIKSSYLLLNDKEQEPNTTTSTDKAKDSSRRKTPVCKPSQLDESQRKEMLNSVKKKFQSRSFFEDARYEKIEGLNWIPWK